MSSDMPDKPARSDALMRITQFSRYVAEEMK